MADQEVRARLVIDQAGDAAEALRESAQSAKELAEWEEKVQRAVRSTTEALELRRRVQEELVKRGHMEDPEKKRRERETEEKRRAGWGGAADALSAASAVVGGGNALGLMAGSGPEARALVAGFDLMKTAAKSAADAINIMGDSSKTMAQKTEALAEKYIPLVSEMHSLTDAAAGVTDRLARQELKYAAAGARSEMAAQGTLAIDAASGRADAARARANGLASVGYDAMPAHDRSTVAGARAHADALATLGQRDALARARAEEGAARTADQRAAANETAAERAHGAAEQKAAAAARSLKRLRKGEGAAEGGEDEGFWGGVKKELGRGWDRKRGKLTGRDKAGIDEAARDAMLKAQQAEEAGARVGAERERHQQAITQLAEKESAARKAGVELAKAELGLLQQKEQRLAGAATKFGMTNAVSRQQGLMAARMVKGTQNLDTLPPELLAQAAQFASEFVQKKAEGFGQQTAEFRAAQREGLIEQGDLGATRKAADRKAEEARRGEQIDIEKNAESMAAAVERVVDKLIVAFEKKLDDRARRIEAGLQQRFNLQ